MRSKRLDRDSEDVGGVRFGRSARFKVFSGFIGVLILSVVGVSTSMVSAADEKPEEVETSANVRTILDGPNYCYIQSVEKDGKDVRLAMVVEADLLAGDEGCLKFFFQDSNGERYSFGTSYGCTDAETSCDPFDDVVIESFDDDCVVEAKEPKGEYRVKWPCVKSVPLYTEKADPNSPVTEW